MSPSLSEFLDSSTAEMIPYGPPLPDGSSIQIADAFDSFEAEYAAIRQRVGVMHLPQRAILQLTGSDVKDYLHRLCTQEINGLGGGDSVRAFQLDEKGHIASDLIVHHGDASTWLEMDVFDLPWVKDLLEKRMFTEDVTVEDWTDQRAVLWLLGPAAVQLLTAVVGEADRNRAGEAGAKAGTHHVFDIPLPDAEAAHCTTYRWDLGSVLGLRLAVPSDRAAGVYEKLLEAAGYEAGGEPDAEFAERRRGSLRGRPVGWSALNTVRIEEGVPMYHIDFGPDSLPAETGLLDEAVSFTKGCYLGQEVVARMKSLGHPKKLLVGWRLAAVDEQDAAVALPVAGSQVLEPGDKQKVIGGVTSSTASPLLGQLGIGFAVVRWGRHKPGTAALLPAGGRLAEAEIGALSAVTQG